jgi:hypothetical protein
MLYQNKSPYLLRLTQTLSSKCDSFSRNFTCYTDAVPCGSSSVSSSIVDTDGDNVSPEPRFSTNRATRSSRSAPFIRGGYFPHNMSAPLWIKVRESCSQLDETPSNKQCHIAGGVAGDCTSFLCGCAVSSRRSLFLMILIKVTR